MSGYSETMADRDIVPHHEYEEENQLREFFKFVREYFEIEQKWDDVQQFGAEHPVASIFLIVTMAACAIPVTLFSIFIVGTIVVSVTGFVFFEGTIIAIASFVLVGALLFAGLFAVGISIFLIAGYHCVSFAGNQLGMIKGQMPSLPFGGGSSVSKHPAKKD